MDYAKRAMEKHYEWRGKIEVICRAPLENRDDLSLAYTPGVAQPCLAIRDDPAQSFELTRRGNLVAVVTDGTAVLGLGDIGPEAAMPVMEGKCALFKRFGGVDAVPLCIRSKDTDEIIRAVSLLAGSFGGINLEDISAPRCFAIERGLKARCDIPVFHDDQHGTAVVTLAALRNALTLAGKRLEDCRAVISGAGAAGSAVTRLLLTAGLGSAVVCDKQGVIYKGRGDMDEEKASLAALTNPDGRGGTLADALRGADIFIGVSAPGIVTAEMAAAMARGAIMFPMSNPVPEIMPDMARAAGAALVGTGRSDFANQINNVLAFPGIFRGALDARARDITEPMKLAAARAIADIAESDGLTPEYFIPSPLDERVAPAVAAAVRAAAGG
ncbi:MAG: NADP-dependent malic enzyme [Oscillospiraceae bacterium]|jgi:malate dehydrogenase (oxaloacetate-decarboxylating)|nr:NADP-dependent malic enzyme [Oscillospiraceae bacterium]